MPQVHQTRCPAWGFKNCLEIKWQQKKQNRTVPSVMGSYKKLCTLLDLCVSSLRRGHANLLCIVPILSDDPREESTWDALFGGGLLSRHPRWVADGLIDAKTARTGGPRLSGQNASSLAPPAGCAGFQHSKGDWSTPRQQGLAGPACLGRAPAA